MVLINFQSYKFVPKSTLTYLSQTHQIAYQIVLGYLQPSEQLELDFFGCFRLFSVIELFKETLIDKETSVLFINAVFLLLIIIFYTNTLSVFNIFLYDRFFSNIQHHRVVISNIYIFIILNNSS